MNFIQTLYINKFKNPYQDSFGWYSPEYHLMGWALSCLQLHKVYKKVYLYANSCAAKLLIDTIGLPYEDVFVTHDKLNLDNDNLWALPKIYTYSIQNSPFLHFDGDVFLFKSFTESFLENSLIAQNREEATEYYISTQNELMREFSYLPDCVKRDFEASDSINAVNAGILGGNDISFIKEYCQLSFQYISKNKYKLSSINVDRFNVFYEQHLFYCLAREKDIQIGYLFNDIIHDKEYKKLGDFHEVPCSKSYLHLLGHFKKDHYTCIHMAAKLRDLYPQYYYSIISLCKTKKVPLFINFYSKKNLVTAADFHLINKKAIETYNEGKWKFASNNAVTCNTDYPDMLLLKELYKTCCENIDILNNKIKMESDFNNFYEELGRSISDIEGICTTYLYGRDLESVNWCCRLFANDAQIENSILVTCEEITVIESEFDWAGLINKIKRVGVEYYENLIISPGQFYNLVIPEVSESKFSLYDLDELEKLILYHLSKPLSIKEVLSKVQSYVDKEVVEHHLDIYRSLIITLLKQLIVKKAIKPYNNSHIPN